MFKDGCVDIPVIAFSEQISGNVDGLVIATTKLASAHAIPQVTEIKALRIASNITSARESNVNVSDVNFEIETPCPHHSGEEQKKKKDIYSKLGLGSCHTRY